VVLSLSFPLMCLPTSSLFPYTTLFRSIGPLPSARSLWHPSPERPLSEPTARARSLPAIGGCDVRGRIRPARGVAGRPDARSVGALALVTLVFLFFLQAQRAYLASLFALVYDAVFPTFSLLGLAAAALPLAALAAPLAPLAYRLGHGRTLVVATLLAAGARVVMVPSGLGPRLVGSSVVLAGAGRFLAPAVGVLDRRAGGAGAALAFTIDGLLRLAGWSYDPSLRPGWLVVQVVLSGIATGLAVAVAREGGLARDGAMVRDGGRVRDAGLVRDAARGREPDRATDGARTRDTSGAEAAGL